MIPAMNIILQRVASALTTLPVGAQGWQEVASITIATTVAAGIGSVATGFVQPMEDFSPPSPTSWWRPLSAFVVPGLLEELIWRAALLPTPTTPTTIAAMLNLSTVAPQNLLLYQTAAAVLVVHVLSHPFCPQAIYPRGKEVFSDGRFLGLAAIVLGGTTLSYIVSGGSVWAAAITHGLPVALWRDFFGGEEALQRGLKKAKKVL